MAHPIVSRIGSSPLGRAGLATISILALAGLAAGGLPLTCKLAPGAAFCTGDGIIDEAVGPVDGAAPHPGESLSSGQAIPSGLAQPTAVDAATLSPEGRGAGVATAEIAGSTNTETSSAGPTPAPGPSPQGGGEQKVALLEQPPLPTLTQNDLVAATFEVLRVELTSMQGDLTTRKVKTVTINPDGTPVLEAAATTLGAEPAPVADAPPEETLVAETEPPAASEVLADDGSSEIAATPVVSNEADDASTSLAYAPARGDAATVAGKGANVRSLPQKGGSEVLFALTGGAEVTIVEMRKGWARIVDPQGRSGWIYGQYLDRS